MSEKRRWRPARVAVLTQRQAVKSERPRLQQELHLCDAITHAIHLGNYPADGKSLTKSVKGFSAEIKGRCDHISHVTPTIFQPGSYLTRLISAT